MKSVELEEQRDRLEEERQELVSNISESRKYTEETVKTLIEVQKAHSVLNKKYEALEIENGKFLNMQRIHDEDFLEKSELIKEQKIALSQLEKSLLEKTQEMSDLSVLVDHQKTEIIAFNKKIEVLNQDLSNRNNEISELKSSLFDENSVQEKFQEMNSKLEHVEKNEIEEKIRETEEKLSLKEAKEEVKILDEEISNKNEIIKEFQEKSEINLKEMNSKIEKAKIDNEMLQRYIIYHNSRNSDSFQCKIIHTFYKVPHLYSTVGALLFIMLSK